MLSSTRAGALGMIAARTGRKLERADPMQDPDPRLGFQFLPEFVRAQDERDVVGPFGIGMPDHARLTAVRAHRMDVPELLEDDRPFAPLAEFPGRGGPHRPAADDDDRKVIH
jgi:hypothetical protein